MGCASFVVQEIIKISAPSGEEEMNINRRARRDRTGWFIESVISASVTVLVIRTRKPFFRSKPGKYLLMATLLVVVATILLPITPLAELLGFQPLPITILLVIGMIVVLYIVAAEIVKKSFYKRVNF
jgi:Mg2+-importing ATPase